MNVENPIYYGVLTDVAARIKSLYPEADFLTTDYSKPNAVLLQDDSDGLGISVRVWNITLTAVPTLADLQAASL